MNGGWMRYPIMSTMRCGISSSFRGSTARIWFSIGRTYQYIQQFLASVSLSLQAGVHLHKADNTAP